MLFPIKYEAKKTCLAKYSMHVVSNKYEKKERKKKLTCLAKYSMRVVSNLIRNKN